jgi:hypothetical protein
MGSGFNGSSYDPTQSLWEVAKYDSAYNLSNHDFMSEMDQQTLTVYHTDYSTANESHPNYPVETSYLVYPMHTSQQIPSLNSGGAYYGQYEPSLSYNHPSLIRHRQSENLHHGI